MVGYFVAIDIVVRKDDRRGTVGVEHNGENRILSGYHICEINYFKIFIIIQNDLADGIERMLM
jgi:hypothetical protein